MKTMTNVMQNGFGPGLSGWEKAEPAKLAGLTQTDMLV